jgi:hypothetical protein
MQTVEVEEFHLRALLITELGQHSADPWLDPTTLIGDVLATLTLTPAQARKPIEDWRSEPIGVIRQLRVHKNLLAPLTLVASHMPAARMPSELLEWLSLRPQLP